MTVYQTLVYTDLCEEVHLVPANAPDICEEKIRIPIFSIEAQEHPTLGHVLRLPPGLTDWLAARDGERAPAQEMTP